MEKRRQYNREYHRQNKDAITIKKRRQRKDNVRYNEYQRNYTRTIVGRAHRMFHGAKRRAAVKNIPFDISIERVKSALEHGFCERTGIAFELNEASPFAPSIDRVDSSGGYVNGNVQIVCCAYNLGKQHMTDEQFKTFILAAAEFMK